MNEKVLATEPKDQIFYVNPRREKARKGHLVCLSQGFASIPATYFIGGVV
jgi:hypothetical protein